MANPLTLPMVRRSLRNLVARPSTRKYPYEIRPSFGGARGKIEFDVATCNYCMLCMRRCPAEAIKVSREDRVWSIEHLRCIACNVCVEVCSKKSLSMSNQPRKPQTPADSIDGRRPGHEEWHLAAPDTTGTPCPDAEKPAATPAAKA